MKLQFVKVLQRGYSYPNFLDFKLNRREFQDTSACWSFKKDLLKFGLNRQISTRLNFKTAYEQTRA